MQSKKLAFRGVRRASSRGSTYRPAHLRDEDERAGSDTLWIVRALRRLPAASPAVRITLVRHGVCPECGKDLVVRRKNRKRKADMIACVEGECAFTVPHSAVRFGEKASV